MRFQGLTSIAVVFVICGHRASADEPLYGYEGDVLPQQAGWVAGECADPCSEAVEGGHLVIRWSDPGAEMGYLYRIATRDDPTPPLPAWIEWSFRSDVPKPPNLFTCDASFSMLYHSVHEVIYLFADAAVSFDWATRVLGLGPEVFHTYRFETRDGVRYRISVDGRVFLDRIDDDWTGAHYVAIASVGACLYENLPSADEWDFVRYGTISYGERIVAADPPAGFLRPEDFPALDRFTVRFEEPNYAYVDEITVVAYDADGNEATMQQGNEQRVGWAVPTDSSHRGRETAIPYPDRKGAGPNQSRARQEAVPIPYPNRGAAFPYPDREGAGPDQSRARQEAEHFQIANRNSAIGNSPEGNGQQATGNRQ